MKLRTIPPHYGGLLRYNKSMQYGRALFSTRVTPEDRVINPLPCRLPTYNSYKFIMRVDNVTTTINFTECA